MGGMFDSSSSDDDESSSDWLGQKSYYFVFHKTLQKINY